MTKREELVEKLNKEFDEYVNELCKLEKKEMLEKSYEYWDYKDIIEGISEWWYLVDEQINVLLGLGNTLTKLYEGWIDFDQSGDCGATRSGAIEDSIYKTIDDLLANKGQ